MLFSISFMTKLVTASKTVSHLKNTHIYKPLINGNTKCTENCEYSIFDSFLTANNVVLNFSNMVKIESGKKDTDLISTLRASLSDFVENFGSNMESPDCSACDETLTKIAKEVNKKVCGFIKKNDLNTHDIEKLLPHHYQSMLRTLFYNLDTFTLTENNVSQRFMIYFLRRYEAFVNQIYTSVEDIEGSFDIEKDGTKLEIDLTDFEDADLLELSREFEVNYYNKSLVLFKKLVTSPLYRPVTIEFISVLKKELAKAIENFNKSCAKKNTLYIIQIYYIVLDKLLTRYSEMSEKSPASNTKFIDGFNGEGFFANVLVEGLDNNVLISLIDTADAPSKTTLADDLE